MELDEFIRHIDEARLRFPADAEESLQKGAKRMTKEIKKASPVGKTEHPRKLNKSWVCTMKGWTADTLHAEIRSKAPHFHLVNRGFRRKNHLGRFVPNKGNDLAHVGFLKRTLDANWPTIREDMDKEFYKRVRDRLE